MRFSKSTMTKDEVLDLVTPCHTILGKRTDDMIDGSVVYFHTKAVNRLKFRTHHFGGFSAMETGEPVFDEKQQATYRMSGQSLVFLTDLLNNNGIAKEDPIRGEQQLVRIFIGMVYWSATEQDRRDGRFIFIIDPIRNGSGKFSVLRFQEGLGKERDNRSIFTKTIFLLQNEDAMNLLKHLAETRSLKEFKPRPKTHRPETFDGEWGKIWEKLSPGAQGEKRILYSISHIVDSHSLEVLDSLELGNILIHEELGDPRLVEDCKALEAEWGKDRFDQWLEKTWKETIDHKKSKVVKAAKEVLVRAIGDAVNKIPGNRNWYEACAEYDRKALLKAHPLEFRVLQKIMGEVETDKWLDKVAKSTYNKRFDD